VCAFPTCVCVLLPRVFVRTCVCVFVCCLATRVGVAAGAGVGVGVLSDGCMQRPHKENQCVCVCVRATISPVPPHSVCVC